ncbi:MAG: hypothetical protein ABR540_10855 [Acidimicrobiales bacterium]
MRDVRIRPGKALARPPFAAIGLAVGAAVLVGFAFVASSWLEGPSFVPRLTIDNPTVYQLEVELGRPGHDAVVGLGPIRRESTRHFEEVGDQGDRCVFRFSYGGQPGGELVVSRAQLEEARWRIVVPTQVGDRLRDAGLPPSGR